MAIEVGCACGQRFSADDQLAGTQAACPNCGGVLSIGAPAAAAPIVFRCVCGQRLSVKPHLVGKAIKCPKCGQAARVPGSGGSPAPTQSAPAAGMPMESAPAFPNSPAPDYSQPFQASFASPPVNPEEQGYALQHDPQANNTAYGAPGSYGGAASFPMQGGVNPFGATSFGGAPDPFQVPGGGGSPDPFAGLGIPPASDFSGKSLAPAPAPAYNPYAAPQQQSSPHFVASAAGRVPHPGNSDGQSAWASIGGGILMMVIAVVVFVVGLMFDRIVCYMPILFVIGLFTMIKGLYQAATS